MHHLTLPLSTSSTPLITVAITAELHQILLRLRLHRTLTPRTRLRARLRKLRLHRPLLPLLHHLPMPSPLLAAQTSTVRLLRTLLRRALHHELGLRVLVLLDHAGGQVLVGLDGVGEGAELDEGAAAAGLLQVVLLRGDEVHGEEELVEALAELGEDLFVGLAEGDAVELDAAGGGEGEVVLEEVWLGREDGFCL